jgi:signal transduction histidine kinase
MLIAVSIAITSAGHYRTPKDLLLWHGLFQRLYYLPVVYAAIVFGWAGGLLTAAVCAVAYVPHIATTWSGHLHYSLEQYAEILMFFAVGGVTGILADRERKRKKELQQTAEELRRVYQELQQSFEQVKRADRLSAIGQLAAGLVHEIRNPLASIEGAAEVMEEPDVCPEIRQETIGIIRRECARLNRLLTALLDFARPRRPEWREVNVEKVIDSVLSLVQHSAGKGIEFEKHIETRLPPLVCDQEQLSQVILNLALNSVQSMPGGGQVRIMARRADGDVLIQIEDQGSGIPQENLDHVFDPFYTTKDNGTGLGLSVVHQIVTQHGGSVSARPNPVRGMTFSVRFPQAKST